LATRIKELRAEADAFIDAKAESMKVPGVPIESIRATLTAKYRGDAFLSAIAILENEQGN
jgi:hypothetical protein